MQITSSQRLEVTTRRPAIARTPQALILFFFVLTSAIGCSRAQPVNIVLVVIDTVRADHLSCYGYDRKTSPFIDELAGRGSLFLQATSTAPYTRPSTASILSGVYPSIHGAITHADSISPRVPMLAELLRDAGYSTKGVYRNGNVAETFGFGRGFESYISPDQAFLSRRSKDVRTSEVPTVGLTDDSLLTRATVPLIDQFENKPFFLYLHLGGAHDPYTPPPEARGFVDGPLSKTTELFYQQPVKAFRDEPTVLNRIERGLVALDEQTRRQIVSLYDGEIAWADVQLGAILSALENNHHLDNTLVIVTSDHGEEFWDHGGLGHGQSNFQELLHVPLVITGPGVRRQVVDAPMSLIDVMPTVLDFARVRHPPGLSGQSFAKALRNGAGHPLRRQVYAEGLLRFLGSGDPLFFRSLQRDQLKVIVDLQRRQTMLFDLAEDPGESVNLLSKRPKDGRALVEELRKVHHSNLQSSLLSDTTTAQISAEQEAELRALGYLGESSDSSPASQMFRRMLGSIAIADAGPVGIEAEFSEYTSAVDFRAPRHSEEQLLYGWRVRAGTTAPPLMLSRAGVILSREDSHNELRIRGRIPDAIDIGGAVELAVRVNGEITAALNLEGFDPFTLKSELAPKDQHFVRIELECNWKPDEGVLRRIDQYAPCAVIQHIELKSTPRSN